MKPRNYNLSILFLLFLFVLLHHSKGQKKDFLTIKGHIKDFDSSLGIGLVKIEICENDTNFVIGISGFDGSFRIPLPTGNHKIKFSHIGYSPKKISINTKLLKTNPLIIKLEQRTIFLDEVIVKSNKKNKAHEVIEKVRQNLSKTLRVGPFQCDGHITSTRMKDGKYVFFGEAFFDHHNSGYAPVGHAYPISRTTNYRISDQDYSYSACSSLFFPPPVQHSLYCYDHYLLPVLLNEYFNFHCADTLFQGTQKKLVINYKLNKEKFSYRKIENTKYSVFIEQLQYGEITVNAEDFSIEKISNKGVSGDLNGAEIKDYISTASFTKINQTHFMSDISINVVYLEPGIKDGKKHQLITETKISYTNFNTDSLTDEELAYRYHCEVFFDNRFNTNSRWFSYLTDKKDKLSTYNPDFWKNKPKPKYWQQMKSDIEKMAGRSLEEQFSSNSFFLISEKKLKSIMKKTDRKKREQLSEIYKELRKTNAFK